MPLKSFWWFLIFSTFLLDCENNSGPPKKKANLIAGIESYTSEDSIKSLLKTGGGSWIIVDSVKTVGKSNRPSYIYREIELSDYSHLGFRGTLRLGFFKNQLMSTMFYPEEFSAYLKKIQELYGVGSVADGKIKTDKNVTIWCSTNIELKKPYIGWADRRLKDEHQKWLMLHT